MMGHLGGLIATWSYFPSDAPQYRIASGLNVASLSTIFLILLLLGLWMQLDNLKEGKRQSYADEALSGLIESVMRDLECKHPYIDVFDLSRRCLRCVKCCVYQHTSQTDIVIWEVYGLGEAQIASLPSFCTVPHLVNYGSR